MVVGPIIEITSDARTTRVDNFSDRETGLVNIGRARDNDVILDDPYIDPYHGQITLTRTSEWSYRDLDSKNGSRLGKDAIATCTLVSKDVLTLGKTQLQIFHPSDAVPPALSLRNPRQRLISFNSWPTSCALLLAAVLLFALGMHAGYTGEEITASMLIGGMLGLLALPLIVSAAWSLLSKILRGRSHFRSIVNVTWVALIALELFEYPFNALAYNFVLIDSGYAGGFIFATVFGLYLYAALLICTRLTTQRSKIIAALVPAVIFGFYLIMQVSTADEHKDFPNYNSRLLPPLVLLRSGMSTDEFIQRLPDIFDEADQIIN